MQSFRVHCVHQTAFGRLPFLTVNRLSHGTLEFDLSCLGNDRLPRIECSPAIIEDLLEGRCVDVSSNGVFLGLTPLEDRVLLECVGREGSVRQFLWKAEIALAWNMMGQSRSGFRLV